GNVPAPGSPWPLPQGNVPAPGSPWPLPQVSLELSKFVLPQQWNRTNDVLTLDPKGFRFDTDMTSCDVLVNAMKRYRDLIFIDQRSVKSSQQTVLKSVLIEVKNINECNFPKHNDDESYTINITISSSAKITSQTVWGALRALETFSQLVYQNDITKDILINATYINDFPRYKFRAMHMDTARHFVPKKVILANLDAMAYNKFNVFHWHIIDDQSFPFESKRYPELTKKGAYSPKHVYTQNDVNDVIEYSRMRGIRVIPEIDSPGHTHAMARAFPELLTPCYGKKDVPYTPDYPRFSASELLNPLKNQTFVFLKELFKEFRQVFKDDFVHLGMDEVNYGCWESNPNIAKFMKDQHMTQVHEVEEYYVKKTLENVKDVGYNTMLWQDPVDNGVKLDKESIVVIWKDTNLDPALDLWQNYIAKIAKNGYQMVLSACWYLNYIQEVEEYYVKKTLENVKDVGYNTMLWQDPVDNGVKLDKESIVVIWKDTNLDPALDLWQNYIAKIAKNGYQMVLSACWYLNYIQTPYPDKDWEKYYLCDPRHFNGTESEKDLVIGGEVCMWSEFVDGTNILSLNCILTTKRPRASSAAERLWSNSNDTQDVDTARLRLDQHRCRLLRRGIPAAPILNGYCGDYEWEMNNQEKLIDLGDRRWQSDNMLMFSLHNIVTSSKLSAFDVILRRGIPAAPILNGYCGDYEWEMNNQEKLIDLGDRLCSFSTLQYFSNYKITKRNLIRASLYICFFIICLLYSPVFGLFGTKTHIHVHRDRDRDRLRDRFFRSRDQRLYDARDDDRCCCKCCHDDRHHNRFKRLSILIPKLIQRLIP
ncbi:unnamed protein product, partial [Oppiella nova]